MIWSREKILACGFTAIVVLLMLAEWLRSNQFSTPAATSIQNELIGLFLSKSDQVFIVITICLWFSTLLWIVARGRQGSAKNPFGFWRHLTVLDFCRISLVVCAVLVYAVGWKSAVEFGDFGKLRLGIDQTTNALVFLAGFVLSYVVELLLAWCKDTHNMFWRIILAGLVGFLAAASWFQSTIPHIYKYREQIRWTGLWVNPNTYGILMGVGFVLATGQLILSLRSNNLNHSNADGGILRAERPYWGVILFFIVGAALCGVGLLKSYSRGAWLGTAVALALLLFQVIKFQVSSGGDGRVVGLLRRNWFPGSVLLFFILVISFWQFRHTESPLARRVFSVGNPNDFSWRNRVTVWNGSVQMMADHPWLGVGWGQVETTFTESYRAPRLEDAMAVQLNDYFTLGTSAGIPALICFLAYVALSLKNVVRSSKLSLELVCGAAVILLLIGFWFDGGLFKLAPATLFWVLLELARGGGLTTKCAKHTKCGHGNLWSFFRVFPVVRSSKELPQLLVSRQVLPSEREEKPISLTAKYPKTEIALRWLAGIVALVALGLTALHLGTPQLAVSERTLSLARKFIVPPKEKDDFEFLAAKPVWSGQPLKMLLQHAHLANYNRTLVNWKLDDQLYREFVLSPEMNLQPSTLNSELSTDLGWRRPLWEFFYPRIRKESSLDAAAEIVVRNLRERMKITVGDGVGNSLLQTWRQGQASEREFQVLCVATLRSVGIPARLSGVAQAEFWNGAEWKRSAPTAAEVKTAR